MKLRIQTKFHYDIYIEYYISWLKINLFLRNIVMSEKPISSKCKTRDCCYIFITDLTACKTSIFSKMPETLLYTSDTEYTKSVQATA